MNISLDELDVEILESTPDNEDDFGGRWGWFWHECHRRPRGPFGSPSEAVADLAEWIGARYPVGAAQAAEPLDEGTLLARSFLATADQFLSSAEAQAREGQEGEVVLAGGCYALELILKSYLLSRGRSDAWNQQNIRHDLTKAWREATFLGLPDDDARIERFLKVAAGAYARHDLFELARERPGLLAEVDYLMAIRVLYRQVDERLPDGVQVQGLGMASP